MKTRLNNTAPYPSECDRKSCATSLTQQDSDQPLSPGRRLTGWCFASLALLACPCHLPFWIMLFSGTALCNTSLYFTLRASRWLFKFAPGEFVGSFFSGDTVTAIMGFSLIFLISLTAALLAFNKIKLP